MSFAKKKQLNFLITTKCNLNCRYCYNNKIDFKHQSLNYEFAKLGIDDFFRSDKSRSIKFFGVGEPTMDFDLMKKIWSYAYKKAGEKLRVEIQTNGCFPNDVGKWLASHADVIWLSWDGPPKIQNHYRPYRGGQKTSGLIEKNAAYLVKNGKGMTGARATIGKKNINKQKEMIEYFNSFGIKYIWAHPIFSAIGIKDEGDIDLKKYAKEFLKAYKFAKELGIFYGSIFTCNFDEKIIYNCRACLPMPHLTTDGYVSACEMASFGEDQGPMQVFIYGKWDREKNKIVYDKEKIKILRSRSADNIKVCKGCAALDHCAGYCPGEVVNETGDLFGRKTSVCEPIRYLAKHMPLNEGQYKYFHPCHI